MGGRDTSSRKLDLFASLDLCLLSLLLCVCVCVCGVLDGFCCDGNGLSYCNLRMILG